MDNPLIKIEDLTVSFGPQPVVGPLTLDIHQGETLAIVGESGSGKSLTALSLLKLLPKTARLQGKVLFQQQVQAQELKKDQTTPGHFSIQHPSIDILSLSPQALQLVRGRQIAMIFQEPMTSLNPVKTCGSQVAEALLLHRQISQQQARQQVIQLFTDVQLPDPESVFDRYPHQISGGQKQRVMIAMAMSCKPELLICDEPTTALDVLVQKDILLLIKRLQQKTGMSVLFISHDIQLVAEMADRVAVFYRGQMVESGPVLELMKAPKNPYTRALLSCRPGLYQPGERLPVVADFMDEEKDQDQQQGGPDLHLHSLQGSSKVDAQAINALEIEKKTQDFVPREGTGGLIENQRNYKDQSPLLILKNLNVWYPTVYHFWGQPKVYNKAVQAVSLEVFQGETLGLVGGSGCGKTTLGRAVMGLTPIHSGEIWYKGKLLTRAGHKETTALAREIQMIFQDPYGALNPKISIGQAIAETLSVHRLYPRSQIKTEVLRWLDRVGLKPEWYDRYPHEFSGGQRQRIVIARALALKPSFVICDESVSALDVSVQAQILNLLNELKAALNFTSIFISHDLSVVHYLSDRIAVMNKGKLEEIGIADQVYRQPASPYTQSLIAAIPKMPEAPSVSASNI